MKKGIFIILGILAFVGLVGGYLYYAETSEDYYYTQIDNKKISELKKTDSAGMKYEYKLVSYNEKGKKKTLTFKTSRELKESAFLKLKVLPASGVNNWEEVQYSELPDKVKTHYKDNSKAE